MDMSLSGVGRAMTSDDQLHLLRNQIAEYETLSGQLARLQAAIRTSLSAGLTSTASFYPHEYDIATHDPTLCGQTFLSFPQTSSGQIITNGSASSAFFQPPCPHVYDDGIPHVPMLCGQTLTSLPHTHFGQSSDGMGMENLCPDTSITSGDRLFLAGMSMENFHSFSSATSGGLKITSRKRWTPTPTQLQVLESMFGEGIVTPNKQKIKDITAELSQHGQISDTNVYNWFQNRRARSRRQQSKRKQTAAFCNSKPEFGIEVAPKRQKKDKSEVISTALVNLPSVGDQLHSSAKTNTESRSSEAHVAVSFNNSAESSISFESMSYYDTLLSSPDFDRFMEECRHLLD